MACQCLAQSKCAINGSSFFSLDHWFQPSPFAAEETKVQRRWKMWVNGRARTTTQTSSVQSVVFTSALLKCFLYNGNRYSMNKSFHQQASLQNTGLRLNRHLLQSSSRDFSMSNMNLQDKDIKWNIPPSIDMESFLRSLLNSPKNAFLYTAAGQWKFPWILICRVWLFLF